MRPFSAWFSRRDWEQLSKIAQSAGEAASARVWQRVVARAVEMSASEARGYIRAHAGEAVSSELCRLLPYRPTTTAETHQKLLETAKDHLVARLLDRLAAQEVEYRRAA